VDDEGFREVLAVEVAGTEKGAAYTPRYFEDSSTGAFQEYVWWSLMTMKG
jgi:hypothetical protein